MSSRTGFFQAQRAKRLENERVPDYIVGATKPKQQEHHPVPTLTRDETTPKMMKKPPVEQQQRLLIRVPNPSLKRSNEEMELVEESKKMKSLPEIETTIIPMDEQGGRTTIIPMEEQRGGGKTIVPMEGGGSDELWANVHGITMDEIATLDAAVRRCRFKPSDSLINSILHVLDTYRGERDLSSRRMAEDMYKMGVKNIWYTSKATVVPFFGSEESYLEKMRAKSVTEAWKNMKDDDQPSAGGRVFLSAKQRK